MYCSWKEDEVCGGSDIDMVDSTPHRCGISISIETLRFCLMKGFSEVNGVMHNTVGCIIGWLMVKGSRLMVKGQILVNG